MWDALLAPSHAPSGKGTPGSVLATAEATAALFATLLAAARRRADRGAYDLASLFLYRAVELIAQRRLHVHGIDPADVRPSRFPPGLNDEGHLLEAVNERLRRMPWFQSYTSLPSRAGLVLAYVLLEILQDPLLARIDLREIANRAEVRNQSWPVHGFHFISEERYQAFSKTAMRVAAAFFGTEGTDMEEWLERATLICTEEGTTSGSASGDQGLSSTGGDARGPGGRRHGDDLLRFHPGRAIAGAEGHPVPAFATTARLAKGLHDAASFGSEPT